MLYSNFKGSISLLQTVAKIAPIALGQIMIILEMMATPIGISGVLTDCLQELLYFFN